MTIQYTSFQKLHLRSQVSFVKSSTVLFLLNSKSEAGDFSKDVYSSALWKPNLYRFIGIEHF